MLTALPVRKRPVFLKGAIRFLSVIEHITLTLNFGLGYFLHLYADRIKNAGLYRDASEAFIIASVITGLVHFVWFFHFLYSFIGWYVFLLLPISFLIAALVKHALDLELEIYERKQAEMEASNHV